MRKGQRNLGRFGAASQPSRAFARRAARAKRRVLPGFRLSFGYAVTYLCLLVLLPLATLVVKTAGMSWPAFWAAVSSPRSLASYELTFGASLAAAAVNAVFGLLVAWVLVRYRFPLRGVIDAMIDLPFALPTAVAGIALTTAYASNGWMGGLLARLGIKVAFTPVGVVVALVFIGLPFVVRTVQPVLQEMSVDVEEAASSLGASGRQSFFRVILPQLLPAVLTGFVLALARGIGEYGSVVFISGNMPMRTEITPLLIVTKLEQFDYQGATALALVLLAASFALLFLTNGLQWWTRRRWAAA